jgi:hypothetical protein
MMGSRRKAVASVFLLTLAVATGCAQRPNGVGMSFPSGSVAKAAGAGAWVSPARTVDPSHFEIGPASASIGVAYPFDLFLHCGGQFTSFSSAQWRTNTPPGRGHPDPSATIISSIDFDFIAGWMIQTGEDTAEFHPASTADVVIFSRTDENVPLCA